VRKEGDSPAGGGAQGSLGWAVRGVDPIAWKLFRGRRRGKPRRPYRRKFEEAGTLRIGLSRAAFASPR